MKPHEETWDADGGCIDQDAPYVSHIGQFGDFGERLESVEISYARARLAAQAPAMARLLLKFETCGPQCPDCFRPDGGEHATDCDLVAVLKAAGVVE